MNGKIEQNRQKISQKLAQSAFRRGSSAFRLGLLPAGISDHLPITASLVTPLGTQFQLTSWNLLSDDHLFNNFMNISGSAQLMSAIQSHIPTGCIYFNAQNNYLHHFFVELGQYLLQRLDSNTVTIDEAVLIEFTKHNLQLSKLSHAQDHSLKEKKLKNIANARSEIIKIILDQSHPDAHEFKLAIRHALELIYHIQHENGCLKWSNRLKLIKSKIKANLIQTDLLCLQECTNPEDILQLFDDAHKKMNMITHRIHNKCADHCVILYDHNEFDLQGEPIRFALQGKKPCIIAKLKNKKTGEEFIIGSIHHPGGHHDHLCEILEHVKNLRQDSGIPFFVAGDLNHDTHHFENLEGLQLYFPQFGTMAGCDFGNLNKSIDAILSNLPEENISVSLLNDIPISPQSATPLIVKFQMQGKTLIHASARFMNSVKNSHHALEDETFLSSAVKLAPLIDL